jgi:hypothetical protein
MIDAPRGGAGGRDVECASDEGGGDVGGGGIVEMVRGTEGVGGKGVFRFCVDEGTHDRGTAEGGGGVEPRENAGGGGSGVVERVKPEAGSGGGGTEAGFARRVAGGGGVGVGPRGGGGDRSRLCPTFEAGLSSGFVAADAGSRAAFGSAFGGSSENARRDDPRPGKAGVGPVAPGGPFMVVTPESYPIFRGVSGPVSVR